MKRLIYINIGMALVGCSMTPRLSSEIASIPQEYLYSDTIIDENISTEWWLNFNDTTLNNLIELALANNRDYGVTLLNVESARLEAANVKATLAPEFSLAASAKVYDYNKTDLTQSYSVMPKVSWDLDLFGKIKSMSESAKATYLSSLWGARAARVALAAEVATTYFTLLQYEASKRIAELTYASRINSLNTIDTMLTYGVTTLITFNQAEALALSAKSAIAEYNSATQRTSATLALLTGEYPSTVKEYNSRPKLDIGIPVGLPSMLLERRPDVIESYYTLVSENHKIGQMRAERLPSFSLTGEGGLLKSIVGGISSGQAIGWSALAAFSQPIYSFGQKKRNLQIARLDTRAAYLAYEQSMLTAVSDVDSALSLIESYQSRVADAAAVVGMNRSIQELTAQLYYTGQGSYLDLLDAERNYFSARLSLEELTAELASSYVQLYKSLGGGFHLSEE